MARVLAIDYGKKRTGLAVTDPLQIIASPLETVQTHQLMNYLKKYLEKENVEAFVIGMPKNLQNRDTDSTASVRSFIRNLKKSMPAVPVVEIDERFTSKIASQAMVLGGMKKSERRIKENVDKLSATIILQSYLESR